MASRSHHFTGTAPQLPLLLIAAVAIALSSHLVTGLVPPVQVVLYGEGLCPACAAFISNNVAPLFDEGLDQDVFRFKYFAYGNARNLSDGVIVCQHGPDECSLNQVINCAQSLYPRQEVWFPFVRCLESSATPDVQKRASGCAKSDDLAWDDIHSCATGDQGADLEVEAAAATAALNPPHIYVPWVTVNGIALGDGYQFLRTFVCAAYTGERPSACSQPPPLAGSGGHPGQPLPSLRALPLRKWQQSIDSVA